MGLGNMITDAYRFAVRKVEGKSYEYVNVAIQPLGLIRDSFVKGEITAAYIFQTLSLGIGGDGLAGYPLLAYYITGKELKDALEIETTVAPLIKKDAHLQVSGVKFAYNPHRVIFDRVTSVLVQEENGEYKPLDLQKLYRVCSNLYATEMINFVVRETRGLLNAIPKDKQGVALSDLRQAIVYLDKKPPRSEELKEWTALILYMKSFGDKNKNGIPEIPEKYRLPEGRYHAEPSWNPVKLIGGGNAITYGLLVLGIILLCLVILLIRYVVRKIRPLNITG
jgi:5'-nucleotidase / UDP-sugar diphosphatase